MKAACVVAALMAAPTVAFSQITPIELTPTDVGSSNTTYFTTPPTVDPTLFFGPTLGTQAIRVNFDTAPDGLLSNNLLITNEYASYGVTMNAIRISSTLYGGNLYGNPGFATNHDSPQVYTFTTPVIAVGIVNTSPDKDRIEFYAGPNATGTLLFAFNDQVDAASPNFNIDRFVGGIADSDVTIGSFRIINQSGNLELDELIFVPVPEPTSAAILGGAGLMVVLRRRRR